MLIRWKILVLIVLALDSKEPSYANDRPTLNPPDRRGGPCRTLRVLRWPVLTKPRRLLRPVLLAHSRGTTSASETTAQTDSVMPNVCEVLLNRYIQSQTAFSSDIQMLTSPVF